MTYKQLFQNVTQQFRDKLTNLIQKLAINTGDLQAKYDQFISIIEDIVQKSQS